MLSPLLMGSLPMAISLPMSCEPEYWVGFWLGVLLTSIILGLAFILYLCKERHD